MLAISTTPWTTGIARWIVSATITETGREKAVTKNLQEHHQKILTIVLCHIRHHIHGMNCCTSCCNTLSNFQTEVSNNCSMSRECSYLNSSCRATNSYYTNNDCKLDLEKKRQDEIYDHNLQSPGSESLPLMEKSRPNLWTATNEILLKLSLETLFRGHQV